MGNAGHTGEENFHVCYSIGKQLGKGAQGHVHVCTDKHTGATRAVKVFDRSIKSAWTTFRREVELCKVASSSCVIGVLEEFVDDASCYMVMERFAGHLRKGLKWLTRQGDTVLPLPGRALQHITDQVLRGILHLHDCSIAHRDIKSHNIFIDRLDVSDERCRVVVGDLGLARQLEQGRLLTAQVGTRKYWAPELYEQRYSHAVDIFALGVLMFFAAVSKYPFLDEDQTRKRDVFAEDAVPESMHPQAQAFLRLALQKDPQKRPAAAVLMRHPWLAEDLACAGEAREGGKPARPFGPRPCAPRVCQFVRAQQPPRMEGDTAEGIEGDSRDLEQCGKGAPATDDERQPAQAWLPKPRCHSGGRKALTPPRTDASLASTTPSMKSWQGESDLAEEGHSLLSGKVFETEPDGPTTFVETTVSGASQLTHL